MNYNTQRCKTVSLVAVNDKPLVISTHRKLISIHFFLHLSSSCFILFYAIFFFGGGGGGRGRVKEQQAGKELPFTNI